MDYNDYVGRIGIGRVFRGKMRVGDNVSLIKLDGTVKNFRVTKIFGYFGLKREEIEEAQAGEGDYVTARQIQERLDQQLETDVSLKVTPTDSPDTWVVGTW